MDLFDEQPYFRFWAKCNRDSLSEEGVSLHLLPYHSLDVAACCITLLQQDPCLTNILARALGVTEATATSITGMLVALHDCGKFAPSFQGSVPKAASTLGAEFAIPVMSARHDVCGSMLLRQRFFKTLVAPELGNGPGSDCRSEDVEFALETLLSAVAGHHGAPAHADNWSQNLTSYFCPNSLAAAELFMRDISALFSVDMKLLASRLSIVSESQVRGISWILAGLCTLSDWLGSDSEWFPYCSEPMPLRQYWHGRAVRRAAGAVLRAGLAAPTARASGAALRALFPWMSMPTPLQKWADAVEIPDDGGLFIVEDVTGSGKTEAALCLAARLVASGRASGIYFALPTMATSNAMARRVAPIVDRLFAPWSVPTFVLSHSAVAAQRVLNTETKGDLLSQRLSADANSWLNDSKKKALWASVGVGTVDQALLSVLPVRHQSMRLAALARSVLIVDEVHAYDSYVSGLLCQLLRLLGAVRQSVILVSATMPEALRHRLQQAYRAGLEPEQIRIGGSPSLRAETTSSGLPYPCVSLSSTGSNIAERVYPLEAGAERRVSVQLVDSVDSALMMAVHQAQSGAATAYVRNSVADAIDSFRSVRSQDPGIQCLLFHARFTLCRRLEIERLVLERFGKESTPPQRNWLLIATQVVEQSLDLDFDQMFSDLAPVELLIQRMGRLHRHGRSWRHDPPLLHVVSPRLTDDPGETWLSSSLRRTAKVYPNHGQLWLAAKWFAQQGSFASPQDARDAVEWVYGAGAEARIPPGLRRVSNAADGESLGRLGLARMNALELAQGYGALSSRWSEEGDTPTRLGLESVTLRLAKWEDGLLAPWCGEGASGWYLSQVTVPRHMVFAAAEGPWNKAIDKARMLMPDRGGETVVVPLQTNAEGLACAEVLDADGNSKTIAYDDDMGFCEL